MNTAIGFLAHMSANSIFEVTEEDGEDVTLDTPAQMIEFYLYQLEDYLEHYGISLSSSNRARIQARPDLEHSSDRPEVMN